MTLPDGLEIREFDPRTATANDFSALTAFMDAVRIQLRPDRPRKTPEELAHDIRDQPSWLTSYAWLVGRGQEVVAYGYLHVWRSNQNQHMAGFWIGVLPDVRRRGIGSELLWLIAEAADAERRSLLMSASNSNVNAGELFLKRFGASLAQTWTMNRLSMAENQFGRCAQMAGESE
jgi:ribosomal protein S18 acetylase RimI-like enzyme